MKKMVERRLDATYQFSTIGGAINYFQGLLEDPRFTTDSRVDVEIEYSYGDEYARVYIAYKEEETDKEYKTRLSEEARQAEYRKQTYERLKKEFEK